jgi:hypothetical protein
VEGRRRYNREWARNKRSKGARPLVDAAEARQAIMYAVAHAGLTYPEISRRSGIGAESVRKIAIGKTKSVKPHTHEALIGIDNTAAADHFVAVEHALPLLYAMHDAGMPWEQVANALGYKSTAIIWGMRKRREHMTGRSFRKIVVLYRLLARAGRVPNAPLVKLMEEMNL